MRGLMQLLPAMREGPNAYRQARRVALSQGELQLGVLALEVLETCPYTSTLSVRQEHSLPWLPVPQMEVRVYHDARMAEVDWRAERAAFSWDLSLPQCGHASAG